MFETWYQPLGLLGRFKVVKPKDLRLKFCKCENDARRIYESRLHQTNTCGALDETDMPLYYEGFRDYSDHSEAPTFDRARLRLQEQRHRIVNRSLIGQQAGLNTTSVLNPALNATTMPNNRTRGYAEMAADVVVTETSLNDSTSTRSNHPVTSRRRVAPNDGRASSSNVSSPSRMRRHNVNFGLSNYVSLPPSTTDSSGIDFKRVKNRFNDIATSIDNLGMSHMSRHSEFIYDAIIKAMKDRKHSRT